MSKRSKKQEKSKQAETDNPAENKENFYFDEKTEEAKDSQKEENKPAAGKVPRQKKGQKKKKLKDHPILHTADKKPKTFNQPPPLKVNPLIRIFDQHQEHKLRIAKIIAAITVCIIAIVFIGLTYENWQNERAYQKHLNNITKRMEIFDSKVQQTEGYKQDQTLIKAIEWTYRGEAADKKNKKKWEELRQKYMIMLQKKFEKPEPGKNFVLKCLAADMASIPQGRFYMGRKPKEVKGCTDELPRRVVQINYAFWMAKTETTNAQYRIFYPQYRTLKHRGRSFDGITQPVVRVNWHLATDFCAMVTYREKKARRLPENYEYRLPTEAEWEYACRAGTETTYYWGDTFGAEGAKYANVLDVRTAEYEDVDPGFGAPKRDGNYITAPVASYKPNAFGLYDMSGNAWEWCWDWYNPKAYRELFYIDPVQVKPVVHKLEQRADFERVYYIDTTSKVIRGGACFSPTVDARSATRDSVQPDYRNLGIGFRMVLAPKIEFISPEPSEDEDDQAEPKKEFKGKHFPFSAVR